MAAGRPRISIVTPVFNAVRYVEDCIRSVMAQGYPDVEHIVIDGGSTDGTVDVLRKYDGRLAYWESERDRGQTHALNKGFRKATGDLLGWLNADEEYLPGSLEVVGEAYRDDGGLDLIYGDRYQVDLTKPDPEKTLMRIPPIPPYPLSLYTGRPLFSDAAFWTRRVHDRLGELNEKEYPRYSMDVEWLLRVASVSPRYRHVGLPLSLFKRHGGNVTGEADAKGLRFSETIRLDFIKRNGISFGAFLRGWLWYSTKLRYHERGLLGMFAPPRWVTISRLFPGNG